METIIIILKVDASKGRDFLVWALSPDLGRLVFVFKRSKDFYEPGLFRVMKVSLEKQLNKTTLQLDDNALYKGECIELIHSYDILSESYDNFHNACELSQTILQLSSQNHACPLTFKTCLQALEDFLNDGNYLAWRVCLFINFLKDFGALPELNNFTPQQQSFLKRLVQAAEKREAIPDLPQSKWLEFEFWALRLLDESGVRVQI
ncbi:hypothetical protein PQO03_18985 [Lentisphaera profundi]|uniref:Recombination protein O n=1 Tax=Lentisphaera profundi TaxID=1658616 RepID=A0ABY7VXI2_9BACT|nr:hypothetical protein [Lentisphaera profundi]WDE97915.1 hypothetical protein PQO03_18985 [Lentisphaera profundi]